MLMYVPMVNVCAVSSEDSDFCKATESDINVCPHGKCMCAVSSESSDFCKTTESESDVNVCPNGTCNCNVCAVVVCKDSDLCEMQSSSKDIRECQMQDPELKAYVKYLEEKALLTDGDTARRLVFENKAFEMIDRVLHHESPMVPGRWCVVVPSELRSQLLVKAHDGICRPFF